jgi:glycine cleavage system H protein
MSSQIPKDLKYTPSHEWARDEKDGTITVGITDHAQALLGDIVYVELPELKKKFAARDSCGVVESVKAAADVYTPLSGEVIAVNNALSNNPELINNDPYGAGWLCRLRVDNTAGLSELLSAENYADNIAAS